MGTLKTQQSAFVSPAVLKWARERSGLSVSALADRANIRPQRLSEWESGDAMPTMRQAQHIAGALHVPFGYFFLPTPPVEKVPLPDFRTLGATKAKYSAELLDVLDDAIFKQEWYRDILREEGRERLKFVGRFSNKDDAGIVAKDIRALLGITPTFRKECGGPDQFLSGLIKQAESVGIVVMKTSVVRGNAHRKLLVEEFRGFAIADDLAPLVFINGSDAKAGQIFTFAHELAHIWISASGISNDDLSAPLPHQEVEGFCNQIAAEVLVPADEFRAVWESTASTDVKLYQLMREFKVSSLVILRRAFDLQFIQQAEFKERFESEIKRYEQKEKKESSGGNFFTTLFARNGKKLTLSVIESVGDGRTLRREAARLLNVKVSTLPKISGWVESHK